MSYSSLSNGIFSELTRLSLRRLHKSFPFHIYNFTKVAKRLFNDVNLDKCNSLSSGKEMHFYQICFSSFQDQNVPKKLKLNFLLTFTCSFTFLSKWDTTLCFDSTGIKGCFGQWPQNSFRPSQKPYFFISRMIKRQYKKALKQKGHTIFSCPMNLIVRWLIYLPLIWELHR